MDEPVQVEQGRYRVLADGQGSWWLYRATGTCETCQGCGCGEQQEPVELPDLSLGMMAVMGWMARNGNKGVMASLGGMLNGGAGGGNGSGETAAKVRRRPGRRRDSNGAVGHADQEADLSGDADRAAAASGPEGGGQ